MSAFATGLEVSVPISLPMGRRARDVKMRSIDVLVDIVKQRGIDTVFGIPGGAISPLSDALLNHPEIHVVITRHESEAVFAACGYSMQGKRPGVAFVTSGPGATNAVTGIASAFADGIPLLILVGEVPRRLQGKGALQDGSTHNLNIVAMLKPITKGAFEAVEPNALPALVLRAMALACSGRPGPVVVTLPLDVQTAFISAPVISHAVESRFASDPTVLDEAALRLRKAERPAIFAGSGVRSGEGARELLKFAERLRIPVITTPKAKGVFPEMHPLSLGVFGIGGHVSSSSYLRESIDVLLAIGSSLGDLATDGWSQDLYPSRSLIHVDIDSTQIGRNYAADIGIVARVEDVLPELLNRLSPWPPQSYGGVQRQTDAALDGDGPSGLIAPSRAIWELQRVLPEGAIYVIDSGEHFVFATHYLELNCSDSFTALTGLGAMGSSIGVAIGRKLAQPRRPVVVIIGDGGFSMTGLEALDAAANRLPIIICVMNDRSLGMCVTGHNTVYSRSPSFKTPDLDYLKFAEAIGMGGIRVEHAGDLLPYKEGLACADRPTLIEFMVDPNIRVTKKDRIGALSRP